MFAGNRYEFFGEWTSELSGRTSYKGLVCAERWWQSLQYARQLKLAVLKWIAVREQSIKVAPRVFRPYLIRMEGPFCIQSNID